jgi:hypothetical protein
VYLGGSGRHRGQTTAKFMLPSPPGGRTPARPSPMDGPSPGPSGDGEALCVPWTPENGRAMIDNFLGPVLH